MRAMRIEGEAYIYKLMSNQLKRNPFAVDRLLGHVALGRSHKAKTY